MNAIKQCLKLAGYTLLGGLVLVEIWALLIIF